jgi:hypothetical protein
VRNGSPIAAASIWTPSLANSTHGRWCIYLDPARRRDLQFSTGPTPVAEELLRKAGIEEAPVPIEQLARKRGALVLKAQMSDGLSGLVFEVDDGAVIAINAGHSDTGSGSRSATSWVTSSSTTTTDSTSMSVGIDPMPTFHKSMSGSGPRSRHREITRSKRRHVLR